MAEKKNKEKQTNYWVVFFLIAPLMGLSWLNAGLIPPLTTTLMAEQGLSYAQIGLLTSVFYAVNIPGCLLTGFLTNVFGLRRLLLFGAVIGTLSTYFFTLTSNFLVMIAWRLVQGLSGSIFWVAGTHFLSLWFPSQKRNLVIGAYNATYWLTIGIYYLAVPILLAAHYKWRLIVQVIAILFGICGVIFWKWSEDPKPEEMGQSDKDSMKMEDFKSAFRNPGVFLMFLINAGIWFQLAGVLTWVPPYLEEACKRLPGEVGLVSMLLTFAAIPALLLGGYVADKTGKNIMTIIIGMVISLSTFLFPWVKEAHLLTLMGVCLLSVAGSNISFGPAYNLPSMILPPKMLGMGFGIVSTGGVTAAVFTSYLGGYVIDRTGSYDLYFIICGLAVIATISICSIIKRYFIDNR